MTMWSTIISKSICVLLTMIMLISLPHRDSWTLLSSISLFTCLQPISMPQACRPKMNRNRSAVEGSTSRHGQVCSKCKGKGHNRASCPTFVVLNLDVNANGVVQEPMLDGRRRPKKYSICQYISHTKGKCPIRITE